MSIRILHFSDTHGETQTVEAIDRYCMRHAEYDVIASTGDLLSSYSVHVPKYYDEWPQKIKLAVPGNHIDQSNAYNNLATWTHKTPWAKIIKDLLFIGIDSSKDGHFNQMVKSCEQVNDKETNGIVILVHERNYFLSKFKKNDPFVSFVGDRELLVLHGHEHPKHFTSTWDSDMVLTEGKRYYRSNVYSAARNHRGLIHSIRWEGLKFIAERIVV